MDQNVNTMDDTLDKLNISVATMINRLEQLVQECCRESVLAHLQTKQGVDDARKQNSTNGALLYHYGRFYYLAPFHVIQALVRAYPDGILEPDTSGNKIRYPIETVVSVSSEKTRNMVFKLFCETNTKCLDNCGFILFHNALCQCDTEVLELMIQTNPKFLYQKDPKYPNLKFVPPIIIACYRLMWEKIDLLLAFDPSQAQMVVEDSKMLPLHIVCQYSCHILDMEFFRQLIEAYPQAAKEKDAKGRLPLHYVCKVALYRSDNQDFVSEMLKIYPKRQ